MDSSRKKRRRLNKSTDAVAELQDDEEHVPTHWNISNEANVIIKLLIM